MAGADQHEAFMSATRYKTGLAEATFPAVCRWSFAQVADADFRPAGV